MGKLEEMKDKVIAKKSRKKIRYSSSNGESEEEGPGDSADEDDLPPWENEEAPPEDAKVFDDDDTADKEESDLEGFVVSDDNEDHDDNAGKLPDSEDEETSARRKSRTVKKK